MLRLKFPRLCLISLLGLIPLQSFAAVPHMCIATGGGFGHGGTTFIGSNFTLPTQGNCAPWAGFTKTASTVILTTNGTACLSTDGKVLTVSLMHADPSFFGPGQVRADYLRMTRTSLSVGFSAGQDFGTFGGGSVNTLTCTTALLQLPATHD